MPSSSSRVRINAGGQIFETSRETLELAGRGSLLGAMLDPIWASRDAAIANGHSNHNHSSHHSHDHCSQSQAPHGNSCDVRGDSRKKSPASCYSSSPCRSSAGASSFHQDIPEIFIDRDPRTFGALLNLLRSGVLNVPAGVSVDALLSDADYLGLSDVVKGALMPPALDANEMHRTSVLRPNVGPADVCTALAAHEDGSVDVAHGARVTCYDWMLRHTATIITDLPQVDAICRLSDSRIIVGGGRGCYHLPIYDTRAYENPACSSYHDDDTGFGAAYNEYGGASTTSRPSWASPLQTAPNSSYSSSYYPSQSHSSLYASPPTTIPPLSPSSLSSYTPSPLTLNQTSPSSSFSPIFLPPSATAQFPTTTTNPLFSPPLLPSTLLPSSSASPFSSPYSSPFAFPPTCKVGSVAVRGASHPSFRSIVQSDQFLFIASLRKTLGVEWGVGKAVGVVDRGTLQSVGEAGPAPITTRRMGGPDKLQWLASRNLLMVVRRYTPGIQGGSEGPSYLRLWDPRCNQVAWDWREFDEPQASSLVPSDRCSALCDATACEDLSLLLKASPSAPDSSSRLSAFDLRKLPPLGSAGSSDASVPVSPGMIRTGSGFGLNAYAAAGAAGAAAGVAAADSGATGREFFVGGTGNGGSSNIGGRINEAGATVSFATPVLRSAVSSRVPGSGGVGPVAVAGGGPAPSIGQADWTVMQWQSPDSLRIGGAGLQRDSGRVETSTIRLLVVPGRSHVICNRCPSLEVWTPVSSPFVPVVTGRLNRWASLDEEKLGGLLPGGGQILTPGSLSAAAAAARGFEPPPVLANGARNTGDETAGDAGESSSIRTDTSTAAAAGYGGAAAATAAAAPPPPPTRFDPYSFRRTYGDTMGEFQRRRVNFEAPPDHWVYDMAFGGNRLFLARDDQRPGGSGIGSIEVWETRTNHRVGLR